MDEKSQAADESVEGNSAATFALWFMERYKDSTMQISTVLVREVSAEIYPNVPDTEV